MISLLYGIQLFGGVGGILGIELIALPQGNAPNSCGASGVDRFADTEKGMVSACQWLVCEEESPINGPRVLILQDTKSSGDWMSSNVNVLNATELVHLKMSEMINSIWYILLQLNKQKFKNKKMWRTELNVGIHNTKLENVGWIMVCRTGSQLCNKNRARNKCLKEECQNVNRRMTMGDVYCFKFLDSSQILTINLYLFYCSGKSDVKILLKIIFSFRFIVVN